MVDLPHFDTVRVLCVGDLMLDRFVEGRVDRISPESPVPILRLSESRAVPGGACNVGRNLAALGGHCTLIGVLGDDAAGAELASLLTESDKIRLVAIRDASRPTTEKTRFVAHAQHMLRVDHEARGDFSEAVGREIVAHVRAHIAQHDVLLLSDYAKGVLTDAVIAEAIDAAREAGKPIVVDPKSARLARYAGATVLTPNVSETALATGKAVSDDASAEAAAAQIMAEADLDALLITRAERGMSLLARGGEVLHIPASAREVYDVVGAGDTVVATLALALGAGLSLADGARLANVAAGIVVGKHGTATVSRGELLDELAKTSPLTASGGTIVLDHEEAIGRRTDWERAGLTVGFTNGCFDILHAGHVGILDFARSRCDRLIVGLNSDASVTRLKGEGRPINPSADRALVLAALKAVDAVVVFEEDTPRALIEALQPDVLVKGSDYTVETIVGADVVLARGGKVLTFDLLEGRSTTAIAARAGRNAASA